MGRTDSIDTKVPGPVSRPLYRMDQTFEMNAAAGPDFDGPFPAVPVTPTKEFFGHPVASRIGVAASLVLNSAWGETFGRLGFDLLTYKTIRSRRKLAHPAPNWLYPDQTSVSKSRDVPMTRGLALPDDPVSATAVGSIGMPSVAPEDWREDIGKTRQALREGQVLIVSVVGTAVEGITPEAFVEDFCALAAEAVEAGAQVVEINLSCPNVASSEGELYLDTPFASRVAGAVRARIGAVPLLVKIGAIEDDAQMATLLRALAPVVDGVSMINAPSRVLLNRDGTHAFGETRKTAGMMGGVNFEIGLDCVRRAVAIIEREALPLRILAVGGVTSPVRIAAYFEAGAYAVMGASALAWDPYLAIRSKQLHPEF